MSKVLIDESTLTSIGNAIRSNEGTTELVPVTEMAERIGALGGGGVVLSDWGNVQLRTLNCLGKADATIDLPMAWSLEKLCDRTSDTTGEYANTTVEHLTINCPNAVESISRILSTNPSVAEGKLTHLTLNVDTSAAKTAVSAFYACDMLKVIDGTPIDLSAMSAASHLSQMFHMCYRLAEVRFKGSIKASITLNKLQQISLETINSVVACLSDDVTGKTITFNSKRINSMFETSEGAADGSSSEEWAAIVGSKPNWTFSLSA